MSFCLFCRALVPLKASGYFGRTVIKNDNFIEVIKIIIN